jgi:hypothetical protein
LPDAVANYAYLGAGLLSLGAIFFPLYLAMPRDLRSSMLTMGVLNACTFPFCALLEGDYWRPVRLGGWRLGLEDAIAAFVVGAVVWGVAIWPLRRRIRLQAGTFDILRRLRRPLLYLILFFILELFGLSWMTSFLATLLLMTVIELAQRPFMWPLALCGALMFVPLYFLYVTLILAIWPEALFQWNPAPPWGTRLLGIPAGELAWSLLFGAALPLIGASILDARRLAN